MGKKHVEFLRDRHAGNLHRVNINSVHDEFKQLSIHSRVATVLTRAYGSMYFVYVLVFGCTAWILLQAVLGKQAFDPIPFAFLLLISNFVQLFGTPKMLGNLNTVVLNMQAEVKNIRGQLTHTPVVDTEHCLALIDSIRIDLLPVHNYIHHASTAAEQQARLMLLWNAISELALALGSRREEEMLE